MIYNKIRLLAIPGSLRPGSSTGAVVNIIANLVPGDVEFNIYDGLRNIPAFDDSSQLPGPVTNFIREINEADAVLFCIPEYAFGVPGALKNALDWTVSSTAFTDKPTALITAASGGEKAHEAFSLTLHALGSRLSEETKLLLSHIKAKLDDKGRMKDLNSLISLKQVVGALLHSIEISRITAQ